MSPDRSPETVESLEREVARLTEERHELFARLAELEAERTAHAMELFTMAAHELRTPLQSLLMSSDLMVGRIEGHAGELTPDWLLDQLRRQQTTLKRLEELMASWLCAPQLRSGTLPIVHQSVDLALVVGDVVSRHADELTWAGCTLKLSLAHVVGDWDRMRLDTIVSNLLSNAIKYGAGKPIAVIIEANDDAATLIVRDQGVGIAAADQERIFERFERASAATRVPGFGVGLWMVRALLRTLGGTITVDSKPGAGASFTVRLARPKA
jgi:signal transduction histidine kinase